MTDRTRTAFLTAVILAAGLALAGCTPGSITPPAPAASETPLAETAAPTPDDDVEVAALVVRADAVEYLDGSAEPIDDARDPYVEPVDGVLARLTEVLGEPAVETYESPFTEGTGTLHRWNGLVIEQFPAGMVADVPDAPTWGVRLESASAGDVDLVTVDGLAVGDPVPDDLERSACNSLMAEIAGTVGVEVDLDRTESAVGAIRAPVYTDSCE